jgi:pyruvate kinase
MFPTPLAAALGTVDGMHQRDLNLTRIAHVWESGTSARPRRQTKIVCTLGPSSSDDEIVRQLVDAGMDIARLNMSHGDHADHAARANAVRRAARDVGHPVAILADLCGPKIRVEPVPAPVRAEAGSEIVLCGPGEGADGDLAISFARLAEVVAPGDPILINDGRIRLTAVGRQGQRLRCRVETGGEITSRKGVNLPGTVLPIPSLTRKDLADLPFVLDLDVDFVAISFVRSAADVADLRRRIDEAGSRARIVSKIEKAEAVQDLDAIVAASDAVMVARGDLGVEIGVTRVPRVQKQIIESARARRKAVITATQMLESMIESPEPTRAEVSDVANAIVDGSSAVMLSAETASGRHPVAAVRFMHEIALDVEPSLGYGEPIESPNRLQGVLARSACDIAERLGAALIAVPTATGETAREISRSRPSRPIVAACDDPVVLRQLALEWGVVPLEVPLTGSAEDDWAAIHDAAVTGDLAGPGETIVYAGRSELTLPGESVQLVVHRVA